ncbi:outer membrane efflux protein [Allomuricauda ruestringensis DSM 13258]|uniref:Outer membrane efflux protein n=1 Tax=Allomuricauda ruestringensis (strain DSM 13258 / CIP 107369 / LMG 19739 / B1) TaxID=886377 RepID=G2PR74_ALLRU|nr:TolC family protein [Allomuricauda ruestringensis]AEM69255.1 outer membrane efflux protein [Allomuricauda ruestringensis DSM 13258]
MNRLSDTSYLLPSMDAKSIHRKRHFFLLLFLIIPLLLQAQQTISLDECLRLVKVNYPLAKQSAMLADQARLDIEAIKKDRLPSLSLNGQATYQSEVTSLDGQLPNSTIAPPNKDQYRTTLDANQLIYHGGVIDASVKVKETKSAIEQQELEVSLYGLKNRVNHLYFSLLLLQENQDLLKAKESQLIARLEEVNAGVKYGTLLSSSADALEVELIKIQQNNTELVLSKTELLQQLSLLIGTELQQNVVLHRPEIYPEVPEQLSRRPELLLFELQKSQVNESTDLLAKSKLPKISAFAQGGYGNPGLNMLDNTFNSFFMTGVKLNWDVFDWNKNRKERQSLQINRDLVDSQKETFELNNNLELVKLQSEIDKMEELIQYDEQIIPRFEKMVMTAESQLKNGVITSSAYITEFTNLYEAKSNLALHKTQKLLNQIQYQITQGTYEKSSN